MGSIVVIFDFDRTIIDGDSDNYVITQMGLTPFFDQHFPILPWNSLMNKMMEELHVQGKTVEDIGECLKQMPLDPQIISAIKSAHSMGCELRVVSDANQFYIETILKHHGLFDFFAEIITNPTYVDDGRLNILPYHDLRLSPHECSLCPSNMCKNSHFIFSHHSHKSFTFSITIVLKGTQTYVHKRVRSEAAKVESDHVGMSASPVQEGILDYLVFLVIQVINVPQNASDSFRSHYQLKSEDPEFETFYTKNILLNEGIRAWMAAQDQPHENLIFPEEAYCKMGNLRIAILDLKRTAVIGMLNRKYISDYKVRDPPMGYGPKTRSTVQMSGMILERIQAESKKHGKNKFIYLGDGGGDYCPTLKLDECDYVMPRTKYPLWGRINRDPSLIKAKVHDWSNGEELNSTLLRLINTSS
ncbi:hypothetical protein KSS87_012295 [Heliosperma pusillum]|nr:hypothetical protein KSS87_012295 [Heliosperma pusillum]